MPAFDIVNKVDLQEVDNAVNMTKKMIATRYDFRKSRTEITLNKKEMSIRILTEDSMKLKAVQSELYTNLSKRSIDPKSIDAGGPQPAAGDMLRLDARIINGIDADIARKIVKMIKQMKLKVQAKIMDDQVRISGKKIDDLQAVIKLLKESSLDVPLQFINMKT